MLINIKVKTLDAQTHEFSIDNEITVREFKDKVAETTNIAADQQRIIYCGRVMVDDKQLKEYDVDGKVVHVAERPPPSQRLPTTDSSTTNSNPPTERRNRGRTVNMRNSPLFRALDGMVVGTMAFPMNAASNGQDTVNPFAASSSFCMNRITVARHMLDCANNIAAYLEDPSRGLNNQSLDILARGRWTMESTVVEVGITSDIPQRQQIVEMVQGAVQAALRRSGNTNVTLVQLPTVYRSAENETNGATAEVSGTENVADGNAAEDANISSVPAAVVIEDVIDEDDDTPTNIPSDNSTAASPTVTASAASNNNDNAVSASNTDDGNDNSRRRTGTPVLATVIEQMRNVQNRLNPFIQQYYELLQNETTFEESDATGRENAQRLFDRVSEAFHYMSHAQHAISDLMLDVSQGTPRYLTCRPILVEQSGYVSSNNFLTTAMLPAPLRQQQTRNTANSNSSSNETPTDMFAAAAAPAVANRSSNNATASNARSDSISGSSNSSDANNTVDDPIDDPVIWQPTINLGSAPSEGNTNNTNASNNNDAGAARANPVRVTTATLPTTSTQTRSTSRPQVHFGNIPVMGMPTNWNGRVLPNNNVSSFDRFLPCNSHHIREPETASNATNDNAPNNSNSSPSTPPNRSSSMANNVTRRPLRNMNDIYQRMRTPTSISRIVGSTMTSTPRPGNNSIPGLSVMREMLDWDSNAASSSNAASVGANSNQDIQRFSIHSQLMNCLNNHIFNGQPINDDTMPSAINRAIEWFGESLLYLPQYEKPEYDSRDSLFNILRNTLPILIELLKKNPINLKEFEQKLKQICEQFRKRLYSVLYICIGQANAEIFWRQLMRLLCISVKTNLRGEAVEFFDLYLTPTIPSSADEADAQQFIVIRNPEAPNADNVQMPMDTDVEMSETATTSQSEVQDEPLPSVVPGSENWHRHFPNDWLPVITRDIQRQTDNPPDQPPFSDAYISGMSSKRRKLVQNSKAATDISALIADSAKNAIQNSEEVSTSANSVQGHTPEVVAAAIAKDPAVQTSCIDAVRTNVRERLQKDADFEANKFPKSNKFINK